MDRLFKTWFASGRASTGHRRQECVEHSAWCELRCCTLRGHWSGRRSKSRRANAVCTKQHRLPSHISASRKAIRVQSSVPVDSVEVNQGTVLLLASPTVHPDSHSESAYSRALGETVDGISWRSATCALGTRGIRWSSRPVFPIEWWIPFMWTGRDDWWK